MKRQSLDTIEQDINDAYRTARNEASELSTMETRRVFITAFLAGVLWSLNEQKDPIMCRILREFIHEIEESEAEP